MNHNEDQSSTPYIDALKDTLKQNPTPFDVPGHHMGNIDNPAIEFFGKELYRADVNAPIGLDNLAHPTGVIKEAEDLMAKACHADEAFFLINGTSSGILAMLLTACHANDKILLPRNCHKSVINGLILSGAIPEWVMPNIDNDLEIADQPSLEAYKKAILRYPSAKAVFVIHPTYFGSVMDLKSLVEFAHQHHMAVLTDEAHGAHYYFNAEGAPLSAMDCGADMSAVSFHKTAGSLTQSSVLLSHNGFFSRYDIQKTLNIINTTSPSTILMASLDGARAFLASPEGKKAQERTLSFARYAKQEIDKIPGFCVASRDHFLSYGSYDFDETKLVIEFNHLDIDGFELYHKIREEYEVQLELAETYAVLAIFSIGTTKEHVDHLIEALKGISKEHYHPEVNYPDHHYDSSFPYMICRPRAAFNAPSEVKKLEDLEGEIAKEQVMVYPPGIPYIIPGEVWTKELIARVKHRQKEHATILSGYPDGFEVIDKSKWKRYYAYQRRLMDYFENRKTVPANDGYRMPFEGKPHKATVILLPFRRDTWREKAKPAQLAYKNVIQAISKFEPVIVGIHPRLYEELRKEYEAIPNVTPLRIRYNDAWARDNMAIFLTNGKSLRAVDFGFNAWGGSFDGLYDNYKDDSKLASAFTKIYKVPTYSLPSFILEGGSIAVDGEGTLIATEACLLSPGRNPQCSKAEIEETLKAYLGVEKVIFVPHGIYNDETDEHIDNMVSFVRPGVLAMAWCDDKNDPQYSFCQQTYDVLAHSTDAKGRPFEIHKIVLPSPALTMTREEAKGIVKGGEGAISRLAGNRLAASYVNYYQGDKFVVMPGFGVKEDKIAYEQIKALYPDKEVIQVQTREILLGGGNIHCITQQIPKEED